MEENTRKVMEVHLKTPLPLGGRRYICLTAVMVLLAACHPKPIPPKDYGVAYNHVRESIGLKPIPSDWVVAEQCEYANNEKDIFFNNPKIDSTLKAPKAYYGGKTLGIRNDSLIYEIDTYGLIRFSDPNQLIPLAILSYIYYYYPTRYGELGWYYDYLLNAYPDSDTLAGITPWGERTIEWEDGRTRRDSEGYLMDMTRAEADSILATWGMSYPN